jgi:hypothetical protein
MFSRQGYSIPNVVCLLLKKFQTAINFKVAAMAKTFDNYRCYNGDGIFQNSIKKNKSKVV